MSNAERIVSVLDELLEEEVSLVVYGRGAIALGFENVPDAVKLSLDVDKLHDAFARALPVVRGILERHSG